MEVLGAWIDTSTTSAEANSGGAFKSVRNVSRLKVESHPHRSIEDFYAANTLPPGLHIIDCGGLPLEILYSPQGAESTSIVFNAALGMATREIPRFMAGPTFDSLPTNTVSVFDACLYTHPSLQLGWYAGSSVFPMQKELPGILRRFVAAAGGSRTLLFGASGGGFAAIYYAQHFPSSQVVAINPQTILANYIPRVVDQYLTLCWGKPSSTPSDTSLSEHIVSDLRKVPLDTQDVIFLQNSSDTHVGDHLLPYILSPANRSSQVLIDKWGTGHISPPREVVGRVLSAIVEQGDSWKSVLLDMGFLSNPSEAQILSRLSFLAGR
ncbi:hypothetical protein [Arthrobacter sp. SX1312]|uniref:hypothetical protein n=1 Tax=Arthrobacter sp. SX1312 TaxID=2058896 RepID=UPI0011AFE1F3|nr:hypothetical protein [Arthrobacter sp. SX1312]